MFLSLLFFFLLGQALLVHSPTTLSGQASELRVLHVHAPSSHSTLCVGAGIELRP